MEGLCINVGGKRPFLVVLLWRDDKIKTQPVSCVAFHVKSETWAKRGRWTRS
jgi:hypothetical protein